MNTLNTELKNQARHLGLCDEWFNSWNKNWTMEKMVAKMYEGIDFCLEHHWPSNEFITKHCPLEFLREHKIFVDDKYSTNNPAESLVLGSSEITFRFNVSHHGILYLRDTSKAKIIAKNRAFVLVHTFDKASVEVEQHDMAQVFLLKHSINNSFTTDGKVTIREEYGYPA